MKPSPALRLVATTLLVMSMHACAQEVLPKTVDEVTDAQVATIQASIEGSCVKRGLSEGASEADVRSNCACVSGIAREQITKREWQRLIMAAMDKDDATADAIFQAHADAMKVCRAKK